MALPASQHLHLRLDSYTQHPLHGLNLIQANGPCPIKHNCFNNSNNKLSPPSYNAASNPFKPIHNPLMSVIQTYLRHSRLQNPLTYNPLIYYPPRSTTRSHFVQTLLNMPSISPMQTLMAARHLNGLYSTAPLTWLTHNSKKIHYFIPLFSKITYSFLTRCFAVILFSCEPLLPVP